MLFLFFVVLKIFICGSGVIFSAPVDVKKPLITLPDNVFLPPDIQYWAKGKINTTIYDHQGLPWYCFTYRQTHCLPLFKVPPNFQTTRRPFSNPLMRLSNHTLAIKELRNDVNSNQNSTTTIHNGLNNNSNNGPQLNEEIIQNKIDEYFDIDEEFRSGNRYNSTNQDQNNSIQGKDFILTVDYHEFTTTDRSQNDDDLTTIKNYFNNDDDLSETTFQYPEPNHIDGYFTTTHIYDDNLNEIFDESTTVTNYPENDFVETLSESTEIIVDNQTQISGQNATTNTNLLIDLLESTTQRLDYETTDDKNVNNETVTKLFIDSNFGDVTTTQGSHEITDNITTAKDVITTTETFINRNLDNFTTKDIDSLNDSTTQHSIDISVTIPESNEIITEILPNLTTQTDNDLIETSSQSNLDTLVIEGKEKATTTDRLFEIDSTTLVNKDESEKITTKKLIISNDEKTTESFLYNLVIPTTIETQTTDTTTESKEETTQYSPNNDVINSITERRVDSFLEGESNTESFIENETINNEESILTTTNSIYFEDSTPAYTTNEVPNEMETTSVWFHEVEANTESSNVIFDGRRTSAQPIPITDAIDYVESTTKDAFINDIETTTKDNFEIDWELFIKSLTEDFSYLLTTTNPPPQVKETTTQLDSELETTTKTSNAFLDLFDGFLLNEDHDYNADDSERIPKQTDDDDNCRSCHLALQFNGSENALGKGNDTEVFIPGLGTIPEYGTEIIIVTTTEPSEVIEETTTTSSTTTIEPDDLTDITSTITTPNLISSSVSTEIIEIMSSTSEPPVPLARAYTVYGEPCIDDCEFRGYSYSWCTKVNPSNNGYWSNYGLCSTNSSKTAYNQDCVDECRKYGYKYYWCHRNTLWGHCTPEHLINNTIIWRQLLLDDSFNVGALSYTTFGDPCQDSCEFNASDGYASCFKIGDTTQRYHCSSTIGETSKGLPCLNSCSRQEEDGSHKCETIEGIGYCSADNLLSIKK